MPATSAVAPAVTGIANVLRPRTVIRPISLTCFTAPDKPECL